MTEMINFDKGNNLVLDSREVANMVGKEHKNLLRDIRGYIENMRESNKLKVEPVEFFQENTYLDIKGEKRTCYDISRKGCEFISNKLIGQKGTIFTAAYINRFHEMENQLQKPNLPKGKYLLAQAVLEAAKMIEEKERIIEEQKPLVEFANKCVVSENTILVRELAKIISKQGYEIGEKRLYQLMREWGMILKNSTEPMQEYVRRGYFEVIEGIREFSNRKK